MDNEEVLEAKMQDSLHHSQGTLIVGYSADLPGMTVEMLEEIPLDFQAFDDRFNDQVRLLHRFGSAQQSEPVNPSTSTIRYERNSRVRCGLNVGHDRFREALDVVGLLLLRNPCKRL